MMHKYYHVNLKANFLILPSFTENLHKNMDSKKSALWNDNGGNVVSSK